MPKAIVFAKYICDQGITSVIAINKLLYLSFGFFGFYQGKFLFEDRIEAWDFGPVLPELWYSLKSSRKTFAKIDAVLDKEEQSTLDEVIRIYGKKAPYLLDELTEKENTPWSDVYQRGKRGVEIDKQLIIDHYNKLLKPIDKFLKLMVQDDFKEVMIHLSKT